MLSLAQEKDLDRIRSVTANYFFWQGLRWVPLGFVIIFLGLSLAPWWPLTGFWSHVALFAAIVIATAGSSWAGTYYAQTFGRVSEKPGAHQRRATLKWLLVYPLMLISLIIDFTYGSAFFISGPVWAVGILAYWWSTGRGRRHYLVAAFCMISLSLVQWRGLVAPGKSMYAVFATLLGATYVIGGLLDHFELREVLKPIKE